MANQMTSGCIRKWDYVFAHTTLIFFKDMVLMFMIDVELKFSFEPMQSHGFWLSQRQAKIHWTNKDYTYVDFLKKAYENATDPEKKRDKLHALRMSEALRDFHTGSLKPINNLIQFDSKPNLDLKEVRVEIYKISVSFEPKCKLVFKRKTKY